MFNIFFSLSFSPYLGIHARESDRYAHLSLSNARSSENVKARYLGTYYHLPQLREVAQVTDIRLN
jgi:hypothetical protein